MDDVRRYTDDEVHLILARAAEESESGHTADALSSRGLTIAELTTIAVEAGIDPAAVARAAVAVTSGDLTPATVQRRMGAPLAVSKSIDLGREISDRTWDRMVMVLRDTFGARGRVRIEGGLREWSNGNLRAVLEPTAHGHRLRVSTRKGDAAFWSAMGNAALGVSALTAVLIVVRTAMAGGEVLLGTPWWSPAMFAVAGVAAHLRNVLILPRWGRERAQQMEALPMAMRRLLDEP